MNEQLSNAVAWHLARSDASTPQLRPGTQLALAVLPLLAAAAALLIGH